MLKMISPLRSKFHHTYFIWQSPGRRCGTAWSKPGVTGDESKNGLQTQDGHTWEPPPSTFLKPLRLPGPDPAKGREMALTTACPRSPPGSLLGGCMWQPKLGVRVSGWTPRQDHERPGPQGMSLTNPFLIPEHNLSTSPQPG